MGHVVWSHVKQTIWDGRGQVWASNGFFRLLFLVVRNNLQALYWMWMCTSLVGLHKLLMCSNVCLFCHFKTVYMTIGFMHFINIYYKYIKAIFVFFIKWHVLYKNWQNLVDQENIFSTLRRLIFFLWLGINLKYRLPQTCCMIWFLSMAANVWSTGTWLV